MKPSQVEGIVELGQPPEAVWSFIVQPENFPRYVAGYRSGDVLSPQTEGVGLRFRWRGASLGFCVEAEEEVIEWTPSRRVRFRGKMAGVSFRSAMMLEPSGAGTSLAVRIEYECPFPPVVRPIVELLVKPLLKRSVRQSLRNLREWDAKSRAR